MASSMMLYRTSDGPILEVCSAMHHGGPSPATTDEHFTSIGTASNERFVRRICYQSFPQSALPPELRDDNPRGIWRLVDGRRTNARASSRNDNTAAG